MTRLRHTSFALRCLSLFAFFLFPLNFAAAQSATATLSGAVEDQNGAAVPGVEITVMNPATALERQVTTNESGYYTVPLLQPGKYIVTARRDGFAPAEIRDVVLNVGDRKALKIQLKAGDVKAEVQVTNDAPLINESPAVTTTIDRQFVNNLPLNGRSFQSLILLTPGVVQMPDGVSTGNYGGFSVNGQRQNANYFTVDGVSANIAVTSFQGASGLSMIPSGALPGFSAFGSTNNLVSVDTLEEFKIQTSTYSAEFGRQPGGQVQLVTRSGGNQFHGTAFEYLRNEAFDANNWFNNANGLKRPPLRQNQFGGTFSGPVFLPRFGEGSKSYWSGRKTTFFFFSYEGQRVRLPATVNTFVPSLRLRQIAATSLKPILNAFPIPTGPETLGDVDFDPITPDTLTGEAPFFGIFSNPKNLDVTSIRADHTVNSRLTLFGRFSDSPSNSLTRNLAQLNGSAFTTRTLTVGATSLFTARLSNDFRFNYSSNRGRTVGFMDNYGGAIPIDVSSLTAGHTELTRSQGRFVVCPFEGCPSIFIGTPVDSIQRQFNVVDNLSLAQGAHQFKLGVDYRRLAPVYGPTQYTQEADITCCGTEIESKVVNGIAFLDISSFQGARPLFNNFSVYFQDTWKVSRRLSLDLGLRWEVNPAPHDANGLRPVLVTGVDNLSTATLAPPDVPFYKTLHGAFAPRAGVAYQLIQASGRETVLRGGFGVYYDLGNGQAAAGFSGFPFVASTSSDDVSFPTSPEQSPLPAFPSITLPIRSTLSALNPNLTLPYTLQWNFGVERSLGMHQAISVSYVASAARRLLTTQSLNNPPTGTPRPNPNFGVINYTTNGPTSDYHALQVQYQRRLTQGLQALVNYTWSHAIDEVSNEVDTGRLERGNASFDVRHNLSGAVTYYIPRPKTPSLITAVLRNWSVDLAVYAQSGTPLDLQAGSRTLAGGTQIFVRPDVVAGVPFWIKDPTVAAGQRLNKAAFALPPFLPGTSSFARQGTLGRNVVRAPGFYQLNMALGRKFNLTERWNLQLRAEAFNVLNHPLFGNFDTNVRGSTFGRARATRDSSLGGLTSLYQVGGPRSMQFSVRLGF